jgi:putative hydrolase of the HAD superfamily
MSARGPLRAVTFDCWGTLIHEHDPAPARAARVAALQEMLARARIEAALADAQAALEAAHRRHVELWQRGLASGAAEMAEWALARFAIEPRERAALAAELAQPFAEAALAHPVVALAGARETLVHLRERGIRRALICDTGFSPGRVVRRMLDEHGLLELLEVQVFSDEAGVPKPHPSVFLRALDAVEARPAEAAHVGDLRRTDVAGARAVGMRTVRIRDVHDDASEHAEADAVADSHAHLRELLERLQR